MRTPPANNSASSGSPPPPAFQACALLLAKRTTQLPEGSAQAWNAGGILSIKNWHGSPSGGGASQIYFGANSSGLTAQQLAQIRFAISGTNYPAAILATGEVVPSNGGTVTNPAAMLRATRNGNTLTLQWGPGWVLQSATNVTGPYQDVSGASSPWPVNMNKPREFFRLRSSTGA